MRALGGVGGRGHRGFQDVDFDAVAGFGVPSLNRRIADPNRNPPWILEHFLTGIVGDGFSAGVARSSFQRVRRHAHRSRKLARTADECVIPTGAGRLGRRSGGYTRAAWIDDEWVADARAVDFFTDLVSTADQGDGSQ